MPVMTDISDLYSQTQDSSQMMAAWLVPSGCAKNPNRRNFLAAHLMGPSLTHWNADG
ncbi:hypothetical protein KYC5002_24405 [Archangium violaceum]|uniref:hypothetical protein n=1 Tax=Archangium violaceum TaxID=83451 RepID=UPI002B3015B6|nr:hypothetical protein KYC5002_24405 [Archangium gephyra]